MKNKKLQLFLFLAMGLSVFITSCIEEPFPVSYYIPEQTGICLPVSPTQAYQTYTYTLDHTKVQDALTDAGVTDLSLIQSAKVKELSASIVSGVDFSEVVSFEVYLKSLSASGLGDQVAYVNDFSSAGATVTLMCTDVNLPKIVTEDLILTARILNAPSGNTNALCLKLNPGLLTVIIDPSK